MNREQELQDEVDRLRAAIREHFIQRADDRCWEDDDRLYAAAGLPPCDRRVGSKAAMLANCARFIDRRCEGGGWPSYAELEAQRDLLSVAVEVLAAEAKNCYGATCFDVAMMPSEALADIPKAIGEGLDKALKDTAVVAARKLCYELDAREEKAP